MPASPEELKRDESTVREALHTALAIFTQRNQKYKSAFKEGGVVDNAFQLRHKAIRMLQKSQDYERWLQDPEAYVRGYGCEAEEPDLDDAYDLINYSLFLIICITEDLWGMSDRKATAPGVKVLTDLWIEGHNG